MIEVPLKYFKSSEFRNCIPSCELRQMDESFLVALDQAREIAGAAFILTSAFRSRSYDLSKGRSGNGYHTLGRAVDVRCDNSRDRWKIVCGCVAVGLSCGLSKDGFVHIDNRPNPIVFLY